MCLSLTENWYEETEKFKNKKRIIGYKVVHANDGNYNSELFCFEWNMGLNKSTRRNTQLIRKEIRTREIHRGFHFFTQLDVARQYANPWEVIIRLEVDPKDIVAIGWYEGISIRYRNFVATKATMLGVSKCIRQ